MVDLFPAEAVTGDEFKFRVIASNIQGQVTSTESRLIPLASVPGMPPNAPTSDAEITGRTQIKVEYEVVEDDGGLPLLSYELQMGRPGTLNDFTEVQGGEAFTLQTFAIISRSI